MIKRLLLLLLFVLSHIVCAQTKLIITKKDSLKTQSENIVKTSKDTIKTILKTTPNIISVAPNTNTNIILAKEENKSAEKTANKAIIYRCCSFFNGLEF